MSIVSPYFELREPRSISDIDSLLALNIPRVFGVPGVPLGTAAPSDVGTESSGITIVLQHSTAGLFRGQLKDWALVPSPYRNVPATELDPTKTLYKSIGNLRGLRSYERFAQRAALQNPTFPRDEFDRLSIAQHFGVPTPLLDWSRSILPAVFFALRELLAVDDYDAEAGVRIYHIEDERLLREPQAGEHPKSINVSCLVRPFYIDRRIERQQGVFTFHPHPIHSPPKVPVQPYIVDPELTVRLHTLIEGLGLTTNYYFPDYAGVAAAIQDHMRL